MSTSDKLSYLATTKDKLKTAINYTGANITNDTFRSYPEKLYNAYIDILNKGTQELFDSLPKVQGTGTSITLNNTKEAPMQLDLKGNTYQDSTTGKNKLPNTQTTQTINGITFTINEDKSVKVKGTASARTDFYFVGDSSNYVDLGLETNNYILSGVSNGSSSTYGLFCIMNRSGSTTNYANYNDETNISIKNGDAFRIFIRVANGAVVDTTIYPMLRLSNTTSDYEPYTNGVAPNPEFPMDIHVVSGDNTIKVQNKNLFDVNQVVLNKGINNGVIAYSSNSNIYYIKANIGDTYTFSRLSTTYSGYIAFTDEIPATGVITYDRSNLNNITNITKTATHKYLILYLNQEEDLSKTQVEKSSTASEYKAYQGQNYPINLPNGMELCKIGDYQDSISKYEDTIKVPSGYTQVEYIESSGTQYIDTGISPTTNTGFKIKASCTTENNSDKVLIGSRVGSNRFWLDFDGTQSPPNFMYGFGSYYSAGNYSTNTDYEISFNYNGSKELIINNNTYSMSGSPDYTDSVPIYLFRANYSSAFAGNFKVYYCQIYNGTTIVRDLVPCIRNSDSAIGMYDLVSKTFFTNAGTGTFTYGREVGSWYIKKATGDGVLDGGSGAEPWSGPNNLTDTNLYFSTNKFDNDINFDVASNACLSHFAYVNNLYNYDQEGFQLSSNVYHLRLRIKASLLSDISTSANARASLRNWLSTHNVKVKYVLATPTYTKIEGTLKDQLEAIKKSYDEQTNISQTNNDLPFVISASAIKEYE